MLERLERLLRALDDGRLQDEELSNWLRQGINRHIKDKLELGAALNLGGARHKLLLARRDYCLLQCSKIIEQSNQSGSRSETASKIEDLLIRFYSGRWKHFEFKPEPDAAAIDELSRWMLRALKTGYGLVGKRTIETILKNDGALNFTQLVVNFYHDNGFDKTNMTTKEQPAAKRVTDEMAQVIWQKRHCLTENWKQREREMQIAEAKRRMQL